MVCMGLAELVGISATSICIVSVSVVFASVSYAVLRFDQMQRATLELALASEAICSEAQLQCCWKRNSYWSVSISMIIVLEDPCGKEIPGSKTIFSCPK